jgi:hypothetical protein
LWAARASHRLLTLVVVVLRPKVQGCVSYLVSGQWGLTSLRNPESRNPKRSVVPDYGAAEYLHSIFTASKVEKLDIGLIEEVPIRSIIQSLKKSRRRIA